MEQTFALVLLAISGWLAIKQVYWWQAKEYRWDRWWSWVRYNQGGGEVAGINWPLRRPVPTSRALAILVVWLITAVGFSRWHPVGIVLAAYIGPVVGIVLTWPVYRLALWRKVAQARRKVLVVSPQIVAVTGSYGKSSTKDFVATLLERKYRVAKTQRSENTLWGVAQRIIWDLKPGIEVLVVEMGAYRRGEIAALCRLVQPNVAVVTGIGNQHLDLFGGLSELKQAKFEVVTNLASEGMAVFNQDGGTDELYQWAKKLGVACHYYEVGEKVGQIEKERFQLKLKKGWTWVPVRGKHVAQNVVGAVEVARLLGLTDDEISEGLARLVQPDKSLAVTQSPSGVIIIDDSHNMNESGFMAAVDYLGQFLGKKYLVTPGMWELGPVTGEVHRFLAKYVAGLDGMWLTNSVAARDFKSAGAPVLPGVATGHIAKQISQTIKPGDVLLIEGRIPEGLRKHIYRI